jgi:hypothetical protein
MKGQDRQEELLIGAFLALLASCLSVYQSARLEKLSNHMTDFHEISYFSVYVYIHIYTTIYIYRDIEKDGRDFKPL